MLAYKCSGLYTCESRSSLFTFLSSLIRDFIFFFGRICCFSAKKSLLLHSAIGLTTRQNSKKLASHQYFTPTWWSHMGGSWTQGALFIVHGDSAGTTATIESYTLFPFFALLTGNSPSSMNSIFVKFTVYGCKQTGAHTHTCNAVRLAQARSNNNSESHHQVAASPPFSVCVAASPPLRFRLLPLHLFRVRLLPLHLFCFRLLPLHLFWFRLLPPFLLLRCTDWLR